MHVSTSAISPERSWLGRRLQSIRWHVRTRSDAWLAVRMLGWRVLLPVLKRAVALERLAPAMRGRLGGGGDEERVVRLASWIYGSRPVAGGKNCLERSLVLYRYLSELNPETRLVIGFRDGGAGVEGHAWVTVGERSLGAGTDARRTFAPAVSYGPEGRTVEGVAHGD
jgi:Transglutaminase-like superfamily